MSWTHHRQALRLPARPLLIGHRGWGGRYPENTLPSLLAARDFGVDAIEIDLMPTRDGEIVLSHEPLLHHQTNGQGPISRFTLSQLQKLDAGYRFSSDGKHFPYRDNGIRLLSLSEALAALPHTRLYLDLKSDDPRFIRSVLAAVARSGLESRAILCSFFPNAIRAVRRQPQRSHPPVHRLAPATQPLGRPPRQPRHPRPRTPPRYQGPRQSPPRLRHRRPHDRPP